MEKLFKFLGWDITQVRFNPNDWNDLMLVVKVIEALPYTVSLTGLTAQIVAKKTGNVISKFTEPTKEDALLRTLIHFSDWYTTKAGRTERILIKDDNEKYGEAVAFPKKKSDRKHSGGRKGKGK